MLTFKRILGKIIIYFFVIVGSVSFIIPLVWMIVTATKPIEQTMSMPPTWLPYEMLTEINGETVSVKEGETIEQPSYVIHDAKINKDLIIAQALIEDDYLVRRTLDGLESRTPVNIIATIPATKEDPWIKVIPEILSEEVKTGLGTSWHIARKADLVKKIRFRWENFGEAIKEMRYFPMYLKNTLILCFLTVIGTVFSSALAAYGFSRVPWRGRNKVFLVALATMMVPFPVVMVPIYCLFRWLGWIGTLRPLWVGSLFAGAFNVFLLRQFFMTIPQDLSDAARIDGCSEWRIFWQIMLPLCRPALMVVGLFQFMGTWNDFLGPLIYLTKQSTFTLALGLQFFQSQHGGTPWHYLMAASTLVGVPIIILFFFTQRSFIEGISMTGLKG